MSFYCYIKEEHKHNNRDTQTKSIKSSLPWLKKRKANYCFTVRREIGKDILCTLKKKFTENR